MDEQQQGQEVTPAVTPAVPAAAVVELLGRDGHAVLVQRVTRWPVRIGRSPVCDIVLDDAHLAPEHAELQWRPEGGVRLQLLDGRNGGSVAGQRLAAGESADLPGGGAFHLAGASLRLRTSADALAPEQLMVVQQARHWALLPALVLVVLLLQWVDRWSQLDPGVDLAQAYIKPWLWIWAAMLAWAGMWSLASQVFQHRFPFGAHLRRLLVVGVVLEVLGWLVPLVAYSLSWPRLLALESLIPPVMAAVLVASHARLVWPGAQRRLKVGIAALLLLGLGLQVGGRQEQQYVFGPPYLASLPPPALRLASPQPPETLIDSLRPLEDELARQARKDNEGVEEDGGDE